MRRFFSPRLQQQSATRHGPALVAIGLAILIAAAWWPAAPVTTAVAIVALGATGCALARLAGSPWAAAVLVLNAIVYVMLYAVFFGAACHVMATPVGTGADVGRVLDLAASIWPMAQAAALSLTAVDRGHDAAGDP